jgi:benzoate-CoA ligase
VEIPRSYNAAEDLLGGNLKAGRSGKLAYIDDAGQCTFGELADRVDRFGNHLLSLGLRMEDRILIAMHDSIDWPVAFLGAIKAGIVPIAVNTLLTPKDYESMLSDSRAKALLVSAPLKPQFEPFLPKLPFLKHVLVPPFDLSKSSPDLKAASTTRDDPCFWLYSSGSTGMPKGTVHVHASMRITAELYAQGVLGIRESDVCFSAAKFFFAYGLGNSQYFPLACAPAILMAERPTPDAVFGRSGKEADLLLWRTDFMRECWLQPRFRPGALNLRTCVSRAKPCRLESPKLQGKEPASRSSTASAPPRCCTFSFNRPATSATAPPARRCRATS